MASKRLKRTLIISSSIIVLAIVLVIVFISPITKYLVQKYDVKYLGREITLNWAYVNPFTGYVHLDDVKVYEANSDSLFFSANGISANFSMHKLLSKTYEVSSLVLDKPKGFIIQDTSKTLNFNDIIERFSPKDKTPKKIKKEPTHFNLLNIEINEGEFIYRELRIPINYGIKKVNIKSSGLRWDSDTIAAKFSFIAGIGEGDAKGDFKINIKNLDYQLATIINKYDLKFIEQYLKDLINYGRFTANLDANIHATGNFKHAQDIVAKGLIGINDFHFGKNKNEDYASFNKFAINLINLSPKNKKYIIDSVSLDKPFLKYERYDHLDNLQTIFGRKGSKVASAKDSRHFNLIFEIGDYIVALAKDFLKSNYKVNRLAIYRGDLLYNDYKLSEKFSLGLGPFYVLADSINKTNARLKLNLKSNLKPFGDLAFHVSINPKDSSDFDMQYSLQKIPVTLFNPYLIHYTSFPLDRGTIEITGNWHVVNGFIESKNHLLVIDPRIGDREKKDDAKWLPLHFFMALVRERSNVIDYEIPITGNLKKPKIHWSDVISDIVTNIFVKPPTTPYGVKVKHVEKEIEKSLYVKWKMRQTEVNRGQEKFIQKIADFLEKNPEAAISVYPKTYKDKEREHVLFYEAKKKYFLICHKKTNKEFTEDDSDAVVKMSIKDSAFYHHVTDHAKNSLLFTIQEKCEAFVGTSVIDKRFSQLLKNREESFLLAFKENGSIKRVKMHANENSIPYNGFSLFKINYKGDIPPELNEAFTELDEYNDESPRNRYSRVRQKIKNMFGKGYKK